MATELQNGTLRSDPGIHSFAAEIAIKNAFRTGILMTALGAGATYLANKTIPSFHKHVGGSGKVASVVMLGFGSFLLDGQLSMVDAITNPDKYMHRNQDGKIQLRRVFLDDNYREAPRLSWMTPHLYMANVIHDHPLKFIASVGSVIIGSVFYNQHKQNGNKILFSQKVMQTRIYSQASIICVLIGTMGIYDYVENQPNHRFE